MINSGAGFAPVRRNVRLNRKLKKAKQLLAVLLGMSMLFNSSCATQALWDETNPRERVWVSSSEVTEQRLIDKGIPYYRSDDQLGPGYLIPKTTVRQLGDYTIRVLATPITVTIDAATTVAVVGVVLLSQGVFGSEGTYP